MLLYVHRSEVACEGGEGRGRKSEGLTVDTAWKRPERPWTAARTMEVLIKAVSPRHCPATSALRNCCFNCHAGQSQGQCPLHCCWGTTRSERSPTFAAQLHLPAHDLFWANLRVQLDLPPLDLAWNPGFVIVWVTPVVLFTCLYWLWWPWPNVKVTWDFAVLIVNWLNISSLPF